MTRKQFLLGAAAAAAPLAPRSLGAARRPNIIWIMADDLGYGDLGCYGQTKIRTHNIDRLRTEGLKFTNAYAGCTVCAPSRSVLMTGFHGGHTTVRSNGGGVPLRPADVTVASLLKNAGYATGIFGKWGLGDTGTGSEPNDKGFDEFVGFLHQAHAHFHFPRFIYHNRDEYWLTGNGGGRRRVYANDVIAQRALDFIRRKRGGPFLCYMPFTVPHWEPDAPDDSLAEYRGKFPLGEEFKPANGRLRRQPDVRAAHAAMVTRLDGYVGEVLALLKELSLERDTLVIFTSDNGSALQGSDPFFEGSGSLRGFKTNLYEGGIRVPMIARWPGRIAPNSTSDFAWSFTDFLATACDLAGLRPPAKGDGVSVLPTLLGRKQKPLQQLYWELPRHVAQTGEFRKELPTQAIRMGPWKAIRPKPDAPLELYNLATDPKESQDLARTEPQTLARLEAALTAARTEPATQTQPAHPWWEARD